MSLPVSPLERRAALLVSDLWPTFARPTRIRGDQVTRDPLVADAYDRAPNMVRVATARWYAEATRAQARALASASEIRVPVVCVQGEDDRVASRNATEAFMQGVRSAGSALTLAQGARHEILSEADSDHWIASLGRTMLDLAQRAVSG